MAETFWFVHGGSGQGWSWVELADIPGGHAHVGDVPWQVWVEVARGDFSSLGGTARFVVTNRRKPGDLLWAGGSEVKLASDRMVAVLQQIGATGWESHPVQVVHKNGDPLPGYTLLAITGACDPHGDSWDPATLSDDPRPWQTASGLDVSVGWDGSDLFDERGRPSFDFLATDRVVQAFHEAGLRGWEKTLSTERTVLVEDAFDDLSLPHEAEVDPVALDRPEPRWPR